MIFFKFTKRNSIIFVLCQNDKVPAPTVEDHLDQVLAETDGYIPVQEHVPDRIGKPVRARRPPKTKENAPPASKKRKRNSDQGTKDKKKTNKPKRNSDDLSSNSGSPEDSEGNTEMK